MARPRIILADTDSSDLMSLQLKFIEEFYEKIDLEIITDRRYFESLFVSPQKAEILIISEDLYDSSLQKHNIAKIFVMTEQDEDEGTDDLNIDKIFKYTSIKEIFNEIIGKSEAILNINNSGKKDPQIIVVTSAAGGVGKTTLATGLSACLAKDYKKVLYMNCDRLQGFASMLQNDTAITNNDIYSRLQRDSGRIYSDIKHVVRNELFSYIPPFKSSLISLGISADIFRKIADEAKRSGDYDYIIVDTDSSFDEEKASILGYADKVIIVVKQNKSAVYSTNILCSNIDGVNSDKYLFVCNDFQKELDNTLISPEMKIKFNVNEYIDHIIGIDGMKCAELAEQISIKRVRYLIDWN